MTNLPTQLSGSDYDCGWRQSLDVVCWTDSIVLSEFNWLVGLIYFNYLRLGYVAVRLKKECCVEYRQKKKDRRKVRKKGKNLTVRSVEPLAIKEECVGDQAICSNSNNNNNNKKKLR